MQPALAAVVRRHKRREASAKHDTICMISTCQASPCSATDRWSRAGLRAFIPGVQRKENVMRSRLLTLTLIAVLTMSFAACSKKNQPQNTAAPASDNSTAAQPNQSAPPSQPASSEPAASQMAPAQQGQQTPPTTAQQSPQEQPAAPASAPEAAKATEPPPPPTPIVIPAGSHITIPMG